MRDRQTLSLVRPYDAKAHSGRGNSPQGEMQVHGQRVVPIDAQKRERGTEHRRKMRRNLTHSSADRHLIDPRLGKNQMASREEGPALCPTGSVGNVVGQQVVGGSVDLPHRRGLLMSGRHEGESGMADIPQMRVKVRVEDFASPYFAKTKRCFETR